MAASPDDPLAADHLATFERALVVLAVTHHGEAAPAQLAPLAAPAGPRCVAAATALLALPAAERATALAREAARLFAPVPAGLERLHPSWLEAALASLPPAAQATLRGALPATIGGAESASRTGPGAGAGERRQARAGAESRRGGVGTPTGSARRGEGAEPPRGIDVAPRPEVLAWLVRMALGPLCAMPPDAGGTADALLATLHATGRERVALALRHAPRSARAAFCSRLPPDEAAALVRAVDAAPDDAAAARRAQGQLAEVAAHAPPEVDGEGLIRRMGALALGAAVAGEGDVPRQLAQLLPRDLGLLLLHASGGAASLPAPSERIH